MAEAIHYTSEEFREREGWFDMRNWNWEMLKLKYKLFPDDLHSIGKGFDEVYFSQEELAVSFI